jgi:hypothetical protein
MTRSARVMLRGCGSSGIVRGFFHGNSLGCPLPRRATPFARSSWSFNFRLCIGQSDLVNAESIFSPTVDVGLATVRILMKCQYRFSGAHFGEE